MQDDVLVLTVEKTKTKRKRLIPISPTLRKVRTVGAGVMTVSSFRLPRMCLCIAIGEPIA